MQIDIVEAAVHSVTGSKEMCVCRCPCHYGGGNAFVYGCGNCIAPGNLFLDWTKETVVYIARESIMVR